ncbi:DUF6134 family protein [uncultured Chitinophaga sp.]|jgi:hypothetical protein|uniref:DUF6134 family protein n=1 Tax=uncultured Chitinophaga sp. TaxID=339340 RepID=UPI0026142863|nr:DUF6134 family protein [uncultured Chitinophaga sp.]
MNRLTRQILFTGLLTVAFVRLPAQVHTFEIRLGSRVIGAVEARCNVNGASRNMQIKSKIETAFMSKFTDISCEYADNILVASKVVRSNGKSDQGKEVITRRNGTRYMIDLEGDKSTLDNVQIRHSVSDLYFTEPQQVTSVYSETLGKLLSIKPLGNGAYELSLPEGKKNIYRYQKGALVEVEVNHTLGKAYIVRTS